AEILDVITDQAATLGAGLNESDMCGTARQRLKSERAGAGKQVEHALALEHRSQPRGENVEDVLAHPIRRGADRVITGRTQLLAAEAAGDDAHALTPRAARTACRLAASGTGPGGTRTAGTRTTGARAVGTRATWLCRSSITRRATAGATPRLAKAGGLAATVPLGPRACGPGRTPLACCTCVLARTERLVPAGTERLVAALGLVAPARRTGAPHRGIAPAAGGTRDPRRAGAPSHG